MNPALSLEAGTAGGPGNAAHETSHVPAIREACRRSGIEVDVVASASGTFVDDPATILSQYDLVFAKAKCALEGMASGAAIILCEVAGKDAPGAVAGGRGTARRRILRARAIPLETLCALFKRSCEKCGQVFPGFRLTASRRLITPSVARAATLHSVAVPGV